MEFKEAMRIWARMCKAQVDCNHCQFDGECPCELTPMKTDASETEAILAKWAAEHPERTIMDDFFEKHPNAPKNDHGMPCVCALKCGYVKECRQINIAYSCTNCWRLPLEEVE